MSILQNTVDRTNVNYEDTFNYNIKVSFYEIETELVNGKVDTFIPDYLDYFVPEIDGKMITVKETPTETGTLISFIFGYMGYEAYSTTIRFQCRFKHPATVTDFTLSTQMYINEDTEPIYKADSPTVTVIINEQWSILKSAYIPSIGVAPGGFVIWKLILRNLGDKGAPITDFTVENTMPEYVTLAEGWEIVGSDTSDNEFADTQFDGTVASFISEDRKQFRFDLRGTYTGTEYTIVVIGLVDADAPQNQYADVLNWSAEGFEQIQTIASLDVLEPISIVDFDTDPPEFAKRGNFYSSIMTLENTGNVNISNVILTIDAPPEISAYKFNTGVFGIPEVNYFPAIEYSIELRFLNDNNETASQIIPNLRTDVNTELTADMIEIPEGYYLSQIIATIPFFVPGMKSLTNPETFAFVNTVNPDTTVIQNFASITWTVDGFTNSQKVSHSTSINENVSLIIIKEQIIPDLIADTTVQNGTVRYKATINCPHSYLYEPILVEILPSQMDYTGNPTYTYYDYQNDISYDSTDEEVPFPLPVLSPSEIILQDGTRIVRFSWTGVNSYDLKQRDSLTIEFDVSVKDADYQSSQIENFMYLGNYGPDGSMGEGSENFPDNFLDYDGDGFFIESLAKSNSVFLTLLFDAAMLATTKIKGSQNLNFVDGVIPIRSRSGSNVTWRLILQNNRDKDLYNVEIVDILPFAKDTTILDSEIIRGSEFDCSYVDIKATVTPVGEEEVPEFTAQFCDGTDPVRFDKLNETTGTQEWTKEPTEATKSVKLVQNTVPFKVGQTLTVDITMDTPEIKEPDAIAYNTFAVASQYINDEKELTKLVPFETFRKGVRGIGTKAITGMVFEDADRTGIYNINDKGVNDILVSLYDSTGNKIDETITRQFETIDGYYAFGDVADGTYYLLFTIDDRKYRFTTQVLDNELGNKANSYGFTPPIEINEQTVEITAYAGVIDVAIENVLRVNKQAQKTVRSTLYSNMTLDMKLNDMIDGFSLGK